MKAVAVFPAERAVRVVADLPPPALESPTSVAVRILDVGVCGTDREICAFQYGTPPPGSPYLVLGHESLGEVVEVGPAVTRVRPGDLVVTMVRRPCVHAHCRACRAGRQDFCDTGEFTERGIGGRHGFMTERIVDDERFVVPVPPALREVGVLVEPLTIAEKALEQIWQVQARLPWTCDQGRPQDGHCHRAVVLGAGPVGLLGAMALVANGFETWVYSREAKPNAKADLVESFGARYVSSETHPLDRLVQTVGNVDLVYEASGASGLSFEMLGALGTNGAFVFTGVPGRRGPIAVDTDGLMRSMVLKNQVVFGTVNAGRGAFEAAVRDLGVFLDRWPDAVRALISGRHPIEAAPGLLGAGAGGIKHVVAIG